MCKEDIQEMIYLCIFREREREEEKVLSKEGQDFYLLHPFLESVDYRV